MGQYPPSVLSRYPAAPITTARRALEVALEEYQLTLALYTSAQEARITPENISERVRVVSVERGPLFQFEKRWSEENLHNGLANLILLIAGATTIVADTAMTESLGARAPKDRSELGSLRAIIYMIRCAFAHDPMRPRWQCRGPYRREFELATLSLTVDLRRKDGEAVWPSDFGGWDALLRMLQMALASIPPDGAAGSSTVA